MRDLDRDYELLPSRLIPQVEFAEVIYYASCKNEQETYFLACIKQHKRIGDMVDKDTDCWEFKEMEKISFIDVRMIDRMVGYFKLSKMIVNNRTVTKRYILDLHGIEGTDYGV